MNTAQISCFVAAMAAVARVRRRTGARRWELFRNPVAAEHFLETFTIATWGEHRRQHLSRMTVLDREIVDRAHSYLAEPPVVHHLVDAQAPIGDRDVLGRDTNRIRGI